MPIYEYACKACDHRFEELLRHSDPDPQCPDCRSSEVTKLISQTSFHLKGTGWYATDYKTSAKPTSSPSGEPNGDSAGTNDRSEGDGAVGSDSASGDSGGSETSSKETTSSSSDA